MIELTNKSISEIQSILKDVRDQKNIKGAQMADKLNVSASWASGMFKQFAGLSTERFIELCDAVDANLYIDPQYDDQTSIMQFMEHITMVMEQLDKKQIDTGMACRKIQKKLKELGDD